MLIFENGWWRIQDDRGFDVFRAEYAQPLPFTISGDDVVVDLGANVGTFSRLALNAGARVTAIEPVIEVFEALMGNCSDALCLCMAASDTDGETISMEYDPTDSGRASSVLPINGVPMRTMTTTVDRLMDGKRVTVLKMDVEGCEEKALRGATDTIRAWRPKMLVSIEHLPDDKERLSAVIDDICPGYVKTEMESRGPGDRTSGRRRNERFRLHGHRKSRS